MAQVWGRGAPKKGRRTFRTAAQGIQVRQAGLFGYVEYIDGVFHVGAGNDLVCQGHVVQVFAQVFYGDHGAGDVVVGDEVGSAVVSAIGESDGLRVR